jgi:carboxyl-terminal processing protease
MTNTERFFSKPHIIGMAVLFVIFSGLLIGGSNAGSDNDNFYADLNRMDNIALKIHQNYVEDIQVDTLIDYGITGMLRILDPHTTYFNANQYADLMMHTEGRFGGLGIQISIRDKVLTVQTPISGTPASRAGIQSGDQIIQIDGKSTAGISIDKAVSKLRGEPNTKVAITIRRKGESKDMTYTITREIITIKPVPYYGVIDDSIGYIDLATFSEDAGDAVEKAVKDLLKKNIKAMVFDLRFDPGGLLPQATAVAEKFLPRGKVIVSTRGRTPDQNHEFKSENDPVLPLSMPMAVLVNYASASASEIVTGAIQDWDRGIVVGDTSFGKGSVQSVLPIPQDPNHHIKLTTAFYYTPSGRCINRPENGVRGSLADDLDEEDNGATQAEIDSAKQAKMNAKKDTLRYQTASGRIVYGSGGIIPDTVVHMEIPNVVVRSLFGKDAFFQFANLEYPRLEAKNRIGKGPLVVDEEIMKDFYHYLDSIKFTYESIAQSKFDDFKKISRVMRDSADSAAKRFVIPGERPTWTEREIGDLKKSAAEIDTLLSRESKREITDNEREIRKYLTEAFLTRQYGQDDEHYWQWKLSDDPQLKTAVSFLTNGNAYAALLKPKQGVTGAAR